MDREMYLKIGRPQNVCVRCGAEIAEAGKHPSALLADETAVDEEADSPRRRDFCPDCWSSSREADYFSFWLARREKPKTKKVQNRKERNSTLLSYFDFLYQKNDPEYAEHLFFISHLLMKFSVFRWQRNEPSADANGPEMIVFKNTVTDDLITIPAVTLHEDRIAVVKREVDEFLSRGSVESALGS